MGRLNRCWLALASPLPLRPRGVSNFSAPWIVYMARDSGAVLLSAPEDSVSPLDPDVADLARTPHVIGRGGSEKNAEADARRQLGPNWRPRAVG